MPQEKEDLVENRFSQKMAKRDADRKVFQEKQRQMSLEYQKSEGSEALNDLLKYIQTRIAYNTIVAKDGIGGNTQGQTVYLTSDQRLSHLDRAAGAEEILTYLQNMLKGFDEPEAPSSDETPDPEAT